MIETESNIILNPASDTLKDSESLKKDNTKKKKKKKSSASSKSVETMFRNAYRAQLDMIALAATKANIMISLNGVIVSILMVTGGFIYTNQPAFLLPAILFLITSAISIYFALSAASPSPAPAHTRVLCCFRDIIKGKASLRDLRNYIKTPEKRFNPETSNILIFEEFAKLPKGIYLKEMAKLVNDPEKTYEKMSDQLYWLGLMADKKFHNLRYSYSVFRWGLILSILVFLSIKSIQFYFPHDHRAAEVNTSNKVALLKFEHIFEPSGIQLLNDGRLLIIEDEPRNPLHIVELLPNGKIKENKILNLLLRFTFNKKLDDLEAITMGPDGYIYATTSHKRNKKGKRKPEREQLIRFKVVGNKIVDSQVFTGLVDAIKASNILGKVNDQGKGGLYNLNIEALSFDQENRLMICLRKPQIDGKSVILLLENPIDVLTKKAAPIIASSPLLLDLIGGGIRAMSYNAELKGYLITNEVFAGERNNIKYSQISLWDGDPSHKAQPLILPGVRSINNVEGITSVTINGQKRLLLISDNGNIAKKRPADYLLLNYSPHSLRSL